MSAVLAQLPYHAGFAVGERGLSLSLNPHPDNTVDHAEWARGWREGCAAHATMTRIAALNRGAPEPVTSMLEPHYWDEADREYRQAVRCGMVP